MHLAQAQRRVAWAAAAWAAALGLWLAWAYALEHWGAGAFLGVWAASLAFLGRACAAAVPDSGRAHSQ